MRRFTEEANLDLDLAFADEPMAARSETSLATAVMLLGLTLPEFSAHSRYGKRRITRRAVPIAPREVHGHITAFDGGWRQRDADFSRLPRYQGERLGKS